MENRVREGIQKNRFFWMLSLKTCSAICRTHEHTILNHKDLTGLTVGTKVHEKKSRIGVMMGWDCSCDTVYCNLPSLTDTSQYKNSPEYLSLCLVAVYHAGRYISGTPIQRQKHNGAKDKGQARHLKPFTDTSICVFLYLNTNAEILARTLKDKNKNIQRPLKT